MTVRHLPHPWCAIQNRQQAAAQTPFHILSAIDSQVKAEDDRPTIGLLLCKTQNRIVAEYALRDTTKPMGIAEYQLLKSLPDPLQMNLPSIEEIEGERAEGEGAEAWCAVAARAPVEPTEYRLTCGAEGTSDLCEKEK